MVTGGQAAGPAAGWDPGAAEEERKPEYLSLEDFVTDYFAPLLRRRLGGHLTWCPEWWRHEEAITRLTVIWSAWEFYRYEGATGLSDWLLHHADPHLAVLMSKDNGPFMSCKADRHSELPPLPCDPPPPGLLDGPAFREPDEIRDASAS
jgi:Domain of unknown function (DUF4913)